MKKFIISSEILKAAIKKLSQAVSKNNALPVLSNLYCKVRKTQVDLITSDVELTIMITCECESAHEFEMLIPFDYIHKIVQLSQHQPLAISLEGKTGTITGEDETFQLGNLDKVKDYPQLPEVPKQKMIKADSEFIQWIGKAQMTCGTDYQNKPALTMICIDIADGQATMASTDATVIFTRSFQVEAKETEQLLISSKVAKALEGFDSAEIYWRKSHIAFVAENTTVIATRHENKYPNYKAVFPANPSNLMLVRADLIGALRRACLSTDSMKTTTIDLKQEEKAIHLESFDETLNRKVHKKIIGEYSGSVGKVAINAEKMLAMMQQVDYDIIKMAIHDEKQPIVITADADQNYKALITLLKVNQ